MIYLILNDFILHLKRFLSLLDEFLWQYPTDAEQSVSWVDCLRGQSEWEALAHQHPASFKHRLFTSWCDRFATRYWHDGTASPDSDLENAWILRWPLRSSYKLNFVYLLLSNLWNLDILRSLLPALYLPKKKHSIVARGSLSYDK